MQEWYDAVVVMSIYVHLIKYRIQLCVCVCVCLCVGVLACNLISLRLAPKIELKSDLGHN